MIDIIPAIDIIDGHCVRLSQGDYSLCRRYDATPADMVKAFADCGVRRIHMVDLDGAKASSPKNLKVLDTIASFDHPEIEWGGGVKTTESLKSLFDAGADCAIIGSAAVKNEPLMHQWLSEFSGTRIILGADARDGKVAVSGWLEASDLSITDLTDKFIPDGLSQLICTDISRDGMLQGVDCGFYLSLQERYPSVDVYVSGGISSMEDIKALDAAGLRRVIVGKALYEGRITMKDISEWSGRE